MSEKDIKTKVDVEVHSLSDGHSEEHLTVEEADIPTRVFYAQRFVEKQYAEVKDEKVWGRWNKYIKDSLFLSKLQDDRQDYSEWNNTNLSIRTATWWSTAGLLTSEIMGASLVPNCMALLGYAPSNIFLVVAFGLTLLSGYLLWWVFMFFDSPEYPIKTMADLAELLIGKWFRQVVIALQLVGLMFGASTCVIANAYAVSILRDERMCYVGLITVLSVAMWILTHVKQLNNLGKWCLVISVCNYCSLFIQLGFMANSEPNWANVKSLMGLDKGPILTYGVTPEQSLFAKMVAFSNLSFVFAGSMVFPEILSEMKRPWDFWKSATVSQSLILGIYLIFGNIIYKHQGQFANSPAIFGLSNMVALKTLSVVSFVVGIAQGLFYSHVSSKILYKNYIPLFINNIKFYSKRGLVLWVLSVTLVWIIIWIIASAVPQVNSVSAFTSSLCMIPLTYFTPFLFHLFGLFHKANLEFISDFDTSTMTAVAEAVPWKLFIKRGLARYPLISTFYILLCLASLAFCGMGIWGSIEYIKEIFATTSAQTFSCVSPI